MIYDKNDNDVNLTAAKTPIDVNSELTPVSHQPVGAIQSHLWESPDVSTEFLNNQLITMQDRLNAAQSLRNSSMISFLVQGIQQLNSILNNRFNKDCQ